MTLRSIFGGARRHLLCALHRRSIPLGDRGPIISFTFDDFPRTALTVGGAILERYGFRGTYYAAMGLQNTVGELGEQFRAQDLDLLLERGHELANHTFGHISSRQVSCREFCEDAERGRAAIQQSTGTDPANFAYPFGDVSFACKRSLQSAEKKFTEPKPGLTSARSIIPGLNGSQIDLSLLRANSLYGSIESASRAKLFILENLERKTWLIFYTHDVRPNPSPYGCTPELLESVVSSASESGSRVMTIQQALSEMGVRNGNSKVQARNFVPV